MILHEIFRVVSRFPRYISCYIAENRFPLGQCTYNNNKRTVDSRAKQLQLVCTATIIELQAAEPYSCRCGLYKLTINLPVRGSVLHLSHQPESSDDSLALRGNEKSCSINQLSSTPQLISFIYFIHILFSTNFQDEVTVFKKFDF